MTRELSDLEKVLNKDKMYWHCCGCGEIYDLDDKDKKENLIYNNGKGNGLDISLDYSVTSGYCKPCFDETMITLNERSYRGISGSYTKTKK